ncbi:tripartite tricarboxylate transporter substrate-binding protein [Pseudorhodoferax sp. Leaf267]|uniref:tripartite tricarboxylate transporter substrate-binding protein n=1 Tax=Pseudorhodoferax sp. Leaf267 TaxID=1736316 RepID=UPI0006F4C4B4|nr:tripartite tricarboxylate transporter substrate-binding protein [Pseudorhodoferax sp. Leaf267]KQP12693.1 ABC transporter substrate-binding protein [Pseudorhodoferax sp. Leaf267]
MKRLHALFALLLAALLALPAQAEDPHYPTKPITIVVTFPPGGGTDLLARKLGQVLQQQLGQAVVVENRAGASGNIGASQVAKAAPDGHTLLMVNSSFAINPGVFGALDFSPSRDFAAVINVGFVPSVLVVPTTSPWHQLADLLAATRGAAQPVFFASCGAGTPQHLAGEMLFLAARAPLAQVPYKGCGPALVDVVSGQVGLGIVTASSAAPLLAAGKLRALGITSPARTAQLPDVPTVAEQGVAGYELDQWHGLLAPAGTPAAVIALLNRTLATALAGGELQTNLRQLGYTLTRGEQASPAAFQALVARDLRRFGTITAQRGLRLE